MFKPVQDTWLFLSRLVRIKILVFKLLFLTPGKPEVRFRMFFEQAGGAFIKLGQILSLRYDLLPPRYTTELLNLLSRVEVLPFRAMEEVFIGEIGQAPEKYFKKFNPNPIASASISQVYRATLWSGEEVAVKIKRPHIDDIFITDFALASFLAGFVGMLGIVRSVNLEEAVAEFVIWTRRELDFTYEANNAAVLEEHAKRHPNTVIPKTYSDLSTSRVLITEFMAGIYRLDTVIDKLTKNPNFAADLLRDARIDLSQMAYYFMLDGMRQYFIDGFFHADPHPANVFFLSDNRLGYFDFGIMGEVDGRRVELLKIIHGIAKHDLRAVSQAFLNYSKQNLSKEADLLKRYHGADYAHYEKVLDKIEEIMTDNFREELEVILAPWYEERSEGYAGSASLIFSKLLLRAEKYSVYVPREMVIFFRSLIIADMVAMKIAPDFNMIKALNLFFREFPLAKAEALIESASHKEELAPEIEPIIDLEFEELMELRAAERERLEATAERLSDLVLYYAEHYEEVRKML